MFYEKLGDRCAANMHVVDIFAIHGGQDLLDLEETGKSHVDAIYDKGDHEGKAGIFKLMPGDVNNGKKAGNRPQ